MRAYLNSTAGAFLLVAGLGGDAGANYKFPAAPKRAPLDALSHGEIPDSPLGRCLRHAIDYALPTAPVVSERTSAGDIPVRDHFSAVMVKGGYEAAVQATLDHAKDSPAGALALTISIRGGRVPNQFEAASTSFLDRETLKHSAPTQLFVDDKSPQAVLPVLKRQSLMTLTALRTCMSGEAFHP